MQTSTAIAAFLAPIASALLVRALRPVSAWLRKRIRNPKWRAFLFQDVW